MIGKAAPVYRITAAGASMSQEQGGRTKRYLISMGLRTLCFVLAILVSGPLRWVFAALAVGLPYFAVIFANAGKEQDKDKPAVATFEVSRTALPPSASPE